MKTSFWELSRAELGNRLARLGVPKRAINMRIAQIWRGVYIDGAKDFSTISTLSAALRADLDGDISLARPAMLSQQCSLDGTRKWLLAGLDGGRFEMVFIPQSDRGTLCLSSQIGCTLTCRFCHTGTQRWRRNLSAGEIISQVIYAFDALAVWRRREGGAITNIVMMGQGEPLFNLDAVIAAIGVFCDGDGLAFSRRRVTVSTAGVVPAMKRLGEETGVRLAVSLHATDDDCRNKLIPLNKKYNLACLLDACRDYSGLSNSRRITFEYVMLAGVNDSAAAAAKLAHLLQGIPAKVNLIPFNAWPGTIFRPSPPDHIEDFARQLRSKGIAAPIRWSRGADIMAACGQLNSEVG